ncbi:hypothetical protein CN918_31835 [Priestia megaterium]|nr:hypothetical protein CN918_31835 [Priestia megaterium]
MGNVIEFPKGKRKHGKSTNRTIPKQRKRKTPLITKLVGITIFFVFIVSQGILFMDTSHMLSVILFISFWLSMFALCTHFTITSHNGILSTDNNKR